MPLYYGRCIQLGCFKSKLTLLALLTSDLDVCRGVVGWSYSDIACYPQRFFFSLVCIVFSHIIKPIRNITNPLSAIDGWR